MPALQELAVTRQYMLTALSPDMILSVSSPITGGAEMEGWRTVEMFAEAEGDA